MAESLNPSIEQLSALPPRQRLEAFRAIPDPEFRQQVGREMPAKEHGEMMGVMFYDGLQKVRAEAKQQPAA
jgi:hypothetical protein